MAKSKWNLWVKVRSALRDIYRYSPMRREAIKAAVYKDPATGNEMFKCAICSTEWHKAMADVDHIVACGSLLGPDDLPGFFDRLMNGKVRVIDKLCHKKHTAAQRRKK